MTTALNSTTTYSLAHTAQCKLQIAASRPDRNLRFLLGHAVMLDNLLVRIVEIENKGPKEAHPISSGTVKPQPPSSLSQSTPAPADDEGQEDEEVDPLSEDYNPDESPGLGLQRFESAAAQPPRMIDSESDSDEDDDDGPISPPTLPADVDLTRVVSGEEDADNYAQLYESVRGCPCHGSGKDMPKLEGGWKVDVKEIGNEGARGNRQLAIMKELSA